MNSQFGISNIIVAIANPKVRLSLLKRIQEETPCRIVSLASPKAYVSPSAQIMSGCIIEPMAVAQTGCIISHRGVAINHASMCCDGVHADCNATVERYCMVPEEQRFAVAKYTNVKMPIYERERRV